MPACLGCSPFPTTARAFRSHGLCLHTSVPTGRNRGSTSRVVATYPGSEAITSQVLSLATVPLVVAVNTTWDGVLTSFRV